MGEQPLRAADLAALLGRQVFDLDDAATFLGVVPGTLWQQVARRRIAYVQYKNHKYFAVADLCDYAAARGKGRSSGVETANGLDVVNERGGERQVREVPPTP